MVYSDVVDDNRIYKISLSTQFFFGSPATLLSKSKSEWIFGDVTPPKVPLVKSKIIFGKPFFQKKFLPPTPIPYIYWKYISKPGFLEKNENEFNNISIRFPSELDQVEKSRIYKVKIFFVVYIS